MKLSIVIPYHNEGVDFVSTTIKSLIDTIDIDSYEIIVVDDFSDVPLSDIFHLDKYNNVSILRHNKNLGVGAAFDTGVKKSESDNIFLMGSDIRFIKNKWASQIVDEIEKYPMSFTCTSCVALNQNNMDINERRLVNTVNGATILMFHDKKSNPTKSETYRGIIEARWLPHLKDRNINSFEIPCILGAAYGVKKSWYNHVDGWAMHRKWGTLEPYISLKSWMFGGTCRTSPRIETGHIFKPSGTHGIKQEDIFYNKLTIATLLLDDYDRLIRFLGNNSIIEKSKQMYYNNFDEIMKKREEYKNKTVYSYLDLFERFNIDYRPDFK